jgi:endonuclease-3
MVTEKLFKIASTPEQFVAMPVEELEEHIHSCGFYHNKAKAIKEMSSSVLALGGVPENREELMTLSGVGRKTANVVSAVAFGKNAIAVDTHVFRVANRIGIADGDTPDKVEEQLMRGFDEDVWSKLHHYLIFHGRYVCSAKKPNCADCPLKIHCKYYKNTQN